MNICTARVWCPHRLRSSGMIDKRLLPGCFEEPRPLPGEGETVREISSLFRFPTSMVCPIVVLTSLFVVLHARRARRPPCGWSGVLGSRTGYWDPVACHGSQAAEASSIPFVESHRHQWASSGGATATRLTYLGPAGTFTEEALLTLPHAGGAVLEPAVMVTAIPMSVPARPTRRSGTRRTGSPGYAPSIRKEVTAMPILIPLPRSPLER